LLALTATFAACNAKVRTRTVQRDVYRPMLNGDVKRGVRQIRSYCWALLTQWLARGGAFVGHSVSNSSLRRGRETP
jgi:hypothetical protein